MTIDIDNASTSELLSEADRLERSRTAGDAQTRGEVEALRTRALTDLDGIVREGYPVFPRNAADLYHYLDAMERRPVWQEAAIWLITNADVDALVRKAIADWHKPGTTTDDVTPYGWIGGQLRNALPYVLDTLLGTSETLVHAEDADPTGSLGTYFHPDEVARRAYRDMLNNTTEA